jgi:Ran-binding protein 3
MTGSLDEQETALGAAPAAGAEENSKPAPTSPARSDKSSDSEGKPVRDKLKETRIDAQSTSDPAPSADQAMSDVLNGAAKAGDSASGSDSDRGRLRKKRSREDFERDNEAEKHPVKKQDKEERHHTRKRSRDIKDKQSGQFLKPAAKTVPTIEEKETDELMASPSQDRNSTANASTGTDPSPKNKRTRDQVEESPVAEKDIANDAVANGKPRSKADDERESKRPRDEDETQSATGAKTIVCREAKVFAIGLTSIDSTGQRLREYLGSIPVRRHVLQAC